MSTDITRGPKRCPSCGQENPPAATRCSACLAPLDAAVQTTPAPASRERHDSDLLRTPSPAPRRGCVDAFTWVGVAVLTVVSAGITFFLTCVGSALAEMRLGYPNGNPLLPPQGLAAVAAVAVAALIIFAFRRWRRR